MTRYLAGVLFATAFCSVYAAVQSPWWAIGAAAGILAALGILAADRRKQPALRPAHRPGPDCPNAPRTCLVCNPGGWITAEASDGPPAEGTEERALWREQGSE